MPIVKVYGVPNNIGGSKTEYREEILERFCNDVRDSIADVKELELTREQVSVFFPQDLMQRGLGEEIVVEVVGLFMKPLRTPEVRGRAAHRVALSVEARLKPHIPQLQLIEVLVYSFNSAVDGFHRIETKQVSAANPLLVHAWEKVWDVFPWLTPATRGGFRDAKINYIWELVRPRVLNVHQFGQGRRERLERDLAHLGLRLGMTAEVERHMDAIMAAKPPPSS